MLQRHPHHRAPGCLISFPPYRSNHYLRLLRAPSISYLSPALVQNTDHPSHDCHLWGRGSLGVSPGGRGRRGETGGLPGSGGPTPWPFLLGGEQGSSGASLQSGELPPHLRRHE
jgi:hypothetical protein